MTKTHLTLAFCGLYIVGMTVSPALLSMSMFGLAIAALIRFSPMPAWRPHWDTTAIQHLIHPWRQPALAGIGVLFLIILCSGLQGGDMHYWMGRLQIKLPLLVIPLMFMMYPRVQERQLHGIYYFLLIWMSILCIGIGINYLLHAEAINSFMKQGQPMPTPRNHIRFSLLMAYGIVCGAYLYWKKFYWKYPWERKVIFSLTIFLFLFMHLLSVRSGLVVIYFCIWVMGLYYTFKTKNYGIGSAALATAVLLPIIAYSLVPSFKAKMDYMSYDRWMRRHEQGALYADSGRITSLEVGYDIFREYPVFGIGIGHMQQEVDRVFQTRYPDLPHPLMPHNQLLYVLASTGIVGLVIFSIAFLYPLFYRRNYRHPMLLASYLVFGTSLLLEHNLENSVGIAFITFFLSLLLNHLNRDLPDIQDGQNACLLLGRDNPDE